MTDTEILKETDRRRRQAMVDADVGTLNGLLSEDLVWTHSSGKKDGMQAFVEKIASGAADYRSLEVSHDSVIERDGLLIHHGDLNGRVVVDGVEKTLRSRFLSVWERSGGQLRLLAWQSTGF